MNNYYTLTTYWQQAGMKHEYLTMGEIFYKLSIYYDDPRFKEAVVWSIVFDRDSQKEFEHVVFQINKGEVENVYSAE